MNNDTNHPLNSTGADGLGLPADSAGLPPIPSTPPPPPPLPEPQPLVETVIPTSTEPMSSGLPPLEPIAPPPPKADQPLAETEVQVSPVILADAGIHSNRFPIESGMTEEEKPVEDKPKKKVNKKLVFGGTLILLLLGGALAIAAQLGLFRGDFRQRASGVCELGGTGIPCDSITCPDGTTAGSDDCYQGGSCTDREKNFCA